MRKLANDVHFDGRAHFRNSIFRICQQRFSPSLVHFAPLSSFTFIGHIIKVGCSIGAKRERAPRLRSVSKRAVAASQTAAIFNRRVYLRPRICWHDRLPHNRRHSTYEYCRSWTEFMACSRLVLDVSEMDDDVGHLCTEIRKKRKHSAFVHFGIDPNARRRHSRASIFRINARAFFRSHSAFRIDALFRTAFAAAHTSCIRSSFTHFRLTLII